MEKIHKLEKAQLVHTESGESKKGVSASQTKTIPSPSKVNEGEDEENSCNEGEDAQVVMRTEVAVAIKDTAQPTFEEIQEY